MTDGEIMTYWYNYLYRNYPFIAWKVEFNFDTPASLFNRGMLRIDGMNAVTKTKYTMTNMYVIYENQILAKKDQDAIVKRKIKEFVKQLKKASVYKIKQDLANL